MYYPTMQKKLFSKSLVISIICLSASFSELSSAQTVKGLDLDAIDQNIKPCDNFYQFACGNWVKTHTVPSFKWSLVRGLSQIKDSNDLYFKDLLEKYAQGNFGNTKNKYAKKIGDFYSSCVNEEEIESSDHHELLPIFTKIKNLNNHFDIPFVLAQLHRIGVPALFQFGSQIDNKDTRQTIAAIEPGSLGLENAQHYEGTKENQIQLREKYKVYIKSIAEKFGRTPESAEQIAHSVFAVETNLARFQLAKKDEDESLSSRYNLKTVSELGSMVPLFDWNGYFKALKINNPKMINLTQVEYIKSLNTLLGQMNMQDFKNYLEFQVMNTYGFYLNHAIHETWFDFNLRELRGQKSPMDRWKECSRNLNDSEFLGNALGRSYVESFMTPELVKKTNQMIDRYQDTLSRRISALSWMDEQTKQEAQKKLRAIARRIGIPKYWQNYDALPITRKSYLKNVIETKKFYGNYQLHKIDSPTNRMEWESTPQTVNAYYSYTNNDINFTTAILQEPLFSSEYTDATNYGAIGLFMGHELTHAFDSLGSQRDLNGVLRNWWTAQSAQAFKEKASCVANQYDKRLVDPSLSNLLSNGKQTLAEDIADIGGLNISYLSYRSLVSEKGEPEIVAGFTGDQQFFISSVQGFCTKYTKNFLEWDIQNDEHMPAPLRFNMAMLNNEGFAKAFGCKAGDAMFTENRCDMW